MLAFSSLLSILSEEIKIPEHWQKHTQGTCRVPRHCSPLSLIPPGLGRGWDNRTPSPPTHPARPCTALLLLLRQERAACTTPRAGRHPLPPKQSLISPSARRQGRHTTRGVISLGFGHSSSLFPFPGQLVARPSAALPCPPGRGMSLAPTRIIDVTTAASIFIAHTTLEISAKQQDEGFIDTSEICFQEYMLISWIPSDWLPGAGCLHSKRQQRLPQQAPAAASAHHCWHPSTNRGGLPRAFWFALLVGFIIKPE